MVSNLDRYRQDLKSLIDRGEDLLNAMQAECFPEAFEKELYKIAGKDNERTVKEAAVQQFMKTLSSFKKSYQLWYSEAKILVKQLMPDRLDDFASHYVKPKSRKEVTYENYKIEDYLQGIRVTHTQGWDEKKVVGPDAAIPQFEQQLAIVKSVRARFESSLFDIRQLVQADLFDSELDAAQELVRNKFNRAAGAVAGVVLERHLAQVCENHAVKVAKKSPVIADLNDALKGSDVIDVPTWRFVQHLADVRNLCDHDKKNEPTAEQVGDLIAGVMKITKTLF